MTIQDLGNIGELVAAIATVATLVYLAIQIRSNTIAVRSAAAQSVHEAFATWYRMIAADGRMTAGAMSAVALSAWLDASVAIAGGNGTARCLNRQHSGV